MRTKEIIEYIKSDLYRYTASVTFRNFLTQYFLNRGFNFMFWFRFCKHDNKIIHKISYLLLNWKRIRYRIDISDKTSIGYGFYIGHSGPVVINSTAIIGNNVNISQFTSIGANETSGAIIADEVYIGPNVCIIENVSIGKSSTIGAGSIVTKDIPENATAAGNYAKVLNFNSPGKYIFNKYIK